jgi:ubiquitin-conjugating enzyme E2 A
MFHPNIFIDGSLCLDIIQDKWKPIYTVSSILSSVQSLLCDPNTDSPANADAARLWMTDKPAYNKRVRKVTQKSLEV